MCDTGYADIVVGVGRVIMVIIGVGGVVGVVAGKGFGIYGRGVCGSDTDDDVGMVGVVVVDMVLSLLCLCYGM